MPSCEILDLRCIILNEIVGSVTLALVLFAVMYFVIASKMKLGFDTTILFLFPTIVILSLAISGFSIVYAFATIMVAIMVGWMFDRVIGNKG